MLYDFYVGSTDRFAAHAATRENDLAIARALGGQDWKSQKVWGVWEGVTENVIQLTAEFPTDAMAQRIAYALAVLTGNDAILVARLATEFESDNSFASTRRRRVRLTTSGYGNRTLLGDPADYRFTDGPYGLVYERDVTGSHVAYLVNRDASVTAVA